MTRAIFVRKSAASKVGPMPVSYTERATCPDACPLKSAGCYARAGFHTRLAWNRADRSPEDSWQALCREVSRLPEGTLWRHNIAGDLPGEGDRIDRSALLELARANRGRRGYTYTHKPASGENLEAIREAHAMGFTISLSADNLEEADALAETGLPVVVVLPADAKGKQCTPAGRTVQVCPVIAGTVENCKACGACASPSRRAIIGFPAHGTAKRSADAIAKG